MFLALAGGVGGAKMAHGLALALPEGALTVAVNTADDNEYFGLHISPDVDTVLYTLAGLNNQQTGWGLADESWNFMAAVERLGGPVWFRLGDKDLATKAERTRRLRLGETLTKITADFTHKLGVSQHIVPMSDDQVRTLIESDEGLLEFHDYFVERQCSPRVKGVRFSGIEEAQPSPALVKALKNPALEAIVICPSNPFLSIDPILALEGVKSLIKAAGVPVIAVSPIIAGAAVKGPLAAIMRDKAMDVSPVGIADYYRDIVDALVIDNADQHLAAGIQGMQVHVTDIMLPDAHCRQRLAEEIIHLAPTLQMHR